MQWYREYLPKLSRTISFGRCDGGMKILITGGTGIIGGAVAEAVVKGGHDVHIVCRSTPSGKWENIQAHYLTADWYDDARAESIVSEGFDVIIDVLIFNAKQMKRSAEIASGHCRQFIYISTDSVYPHPGSNVSEDTDISAEDIKWKYGKGKYEAEQYLKAHGQGYGFFWTVIRPTITFGETRIPVGFASRRNTYSLVERIISHKPVIRFDDPSSRHALCHVSVFGSAVSGLLLNENASGKCYHISDDKAYTYDEIFACIERITGTKCKYVFLPAEAIRSFTPFYEDMIYDKDPEFTLDNTRIRSVCPDVNYSCDLDQVMAVTLKALKDRNASDSDYEMISDLILLRNAGSLDEEARAYVDGFTAEYVNALKGFEHDYAAQQRKQRIKGLLSPAVRAVKRITGKK